MYIYEFFSVVIGQLLAFLDVPFCKDKDARFVYFHLAIRSVRVVYVSGCIATHRAINGLIFVHLKEILASALVFFFLGYDSSDILNDALSFWNCFSGKKPESC